MANELKAGRMGSPAVGGKPAEFANSMAERIEDEYWNLLAPERRFDRGTNLETDRDRRRLFVAIARGVVGYLRDNEAALQVVGDIPLPNKPRIDVKQADG